MLDEAVRSISEALRVSQNNSDEQAINICLSYLCQVAGILGHHKQESALLSHSIQHSLKNNMPRLALANSMNAGVLSHRYCDSQPGKSGGAVMNWMDVLHLAFKRSLNIVNEGRITSDLDNMLKQDRAEIGIFQAFLLKGQLQPGLERLVSGDWQMLLSLDSINESSLELLLEICLETLDESVEKSLDILALLTASSSSEYKPNLLFFYYLINCKMFLDRGEYTSARFFEEKAYSTLIHLHAPIYKALIWCIRNERLYMEGNYSEAYVSLNRFLEYGEDKGLIRKCLQQRILLAKLHTKTHSVPKALELLLDLKGMTKEFGMKAELVECQLLLCSLFMKIGKYEKVDKSIESYKFDYNLEIEFSYLPTLSNNLKASFFKIKALNALSNGLRRTGLTPLIQIL